MSKTTQTGIGLVCNTSIKTVKRNVRVNSKRKIPWIENTPASNNDIAICGGGPSLADTFKEICYRQDKGQKIMALNGAAKFLTENGIKCDYQVIVDPRAKNLKFIRGQWANELLLASQCSTALFNYAWLTRRKVSLFHCLIKNLDHLLPSGKGQYFAVGGGITSGLTAISLAFLMGFRKIHLYGYDSSDRDGQIHPYPQNETEAENARIEVECNSKKFQTSLAMFEQARNFQAFSDMLVNEGAIITVHGSGLLPEIAKAKTGIRDFSKVIYDFTTHPAGYDFTTWLVKAEMMRRINGSPSPLRVGFRYRDGDQFRKNQISQDFSQRMLDRVMRPALEMIGAIEDNSFDDGILYDYNMKEIVDTVRLGHKVPYWQPPRHAMDYVDSYLREHFDTNPIVITLREARHHPQRNSNMKAWIRFANRLRDQGKPFIFVRDTEMADEPLDDFMTMPLASKNIHIRTALYNRARCNLQVANGPGILAYLSPIPYLIFKNLVDQKIFDWPTGTAAWWENVIGVPAGTDYPWATPYQRFIWTNDSFEEICAAWDYHERALPPVSEYLPPIDRLPPMAAE